MDGDCILVAFISIYSLRNQFDFGARFLVRFCRVTKMNKSAPWMAQDKCREAKLKTNTKAAVASATNQVSINSNAKIESPTK